MSLLGPFSYGPCHHLGPSPIAPARMTQQPPPWAPSPWVHFPHGSQDPSHSIHMSRLTLAQSHSPYRVLPYDLSDLPPSTLPTGPRVHKLPPAQGLHPTCPLPEVGVGGGGAVYLQIPTWLTPFQLFLRCSSAGTLLWSLGVTQQPLPHLVQPLFCTTLPPGMPPQLTLCCMPTYLFICHLLPPVECHLRGDRDSLSVPFTALLSEPRTVPVTGS